MRLADAPVLPFEFTGLAETIGRYTEELEKLAPQESKVDLTPLKAAQRVLAASAQAYEAKLSGAGAAGSIFDAGADRLRELNRLLFQSERLLTDPEGLPRRPWFKHQLYAPGFYTGYGVKTLPYIRESLEQKQWAEAAKGVEIVRRRLAALAAQIDSAAGLLR